MHNCNPEINFASSLTFRMHIPLISIFVNFSIESIDILKWYDDLTVKVVIQNLYCTIIRNNGKYFFIYDNSWYFKSKNFHESNPKLMHEQSWMKSWREIKRATIIVYMHCPLNYNYRNWNPFIIFWWLSILGSTFAPPKNFDIKEKTYECRLVFISDNECLFPNIEYRHWTYKNVWVFLKRFWKKCSV